MKKVIINQSDYKLIDHEGNKYYVRWNPEVMLNMDGSESDKYVVCESVFIGIPSILDIKAEIDAYINGETDRKIAQGFRWNGDLVWLSLEDQMNYKGAYDLCKQTNGEGILPLTIKVGYSNAPKYITFETVEDFSEFYIAMFSYVQQTLAAGWQRKDAVDYTDYSEALRNLVTQS